MCEIKRSKIKIIGVGGAGCNIIHRLLKNTIDGIDYYVTDSDEEVLSNSKCENKVKADSTCESWAELLCGSFEAIIADADMVIIVSGLGGLFGSTFTPMLVGSAKELNKVAIVIGTIPFEFEGKPRMAKCIHSLEQLKKLSIPLILIPLHKLKLFVPKTTTMKVAISISDAVIDEAVKCIVLPVCKEGAINVEYSEIAEIFQTGGLAYFGVGIGEGDNYVQNAVKGAINNPLSVTKLNTVNKILVDVTVGLGLLQDVQSVAEAVYKATDTNSFITFTARYNENWGNKIHVSIIGIPDTITINRVENVSPLDKSVYFNDHLNEELKRVLSEAEKLSKQCDTAYIASEHIVYAMLSTNCKAGLILKSSGCSEDIFGRFFYKSLNCTQAIKGYTPRTKRILWNAQEDVILTRGADAEVGTEHILYSIISCESLAYRILVAMGINIKELKEKLEREINS